MNRLYKLTFFCSLFASLTFAQEQMQNPGFEVWENFGTATAEPENWSSLKTADALASQAPVVIERADGRQGGYSVRLENKLVLGLSANGLLTNGRVHADFDPELGYVYTNANDARWNTPFVSRPDSLVGWYKFAPVGGDKGKVEVYLHKTGNCRIPENESNPNQLVATARFDILAAQSQWTRFSVPFNYLSADAPEYILSVVTSGDSTQAVVGSVAHFDDFELIYNLNVTTGQLSSNNYSITNTTGASIEVPFTVVGGLFSPANEFIAELSDANGNFSNPIVLGSLTSDVSGTVSGLIPAQIQPGTAYRVRVRPTEVIAGYTLVLTDNGEDITIELDGSYIGFVGQSTSIVGEDPIELMVYESPLATDREWKFSLSSGGPFESFEPIRDGVTESFSFESGGFYYVICESMISGEVSISNEQALYFGVLSTENHKKEENQFLAYQTGDKIIIKSNQQGDYMIFDALGRKMKVGALSGTSSFSPDQTGLYFIQFSNGQELITRKVLFSTNF